MKTFSNPFRNGASIAPPFKRVLLSKTTQLGDLVISLPMAAALKKQDPHCTVILLTNRKTIDVAQYCPDVDEVYGEPATAEERLALLRSLNIDIFIQVNTSREMATSAYEAQIPVRIGSLFRSYNLRRCTHLVALTRSCWGLNKRLLDLQYLRPLGVKIDDLQEVRDLYHLAPPRLAGGSPSHPGHFSQGRRTVILSPALVTASAHQWPLESYSRVIHSLDPDRFHWFVCGTPEDRENLQPLLDRHCDDANVTDLVGKLTLTEFMSFMANCDGLIAGSTGPLHLAAALGIHTLGLFQSRQADIRRWHPVGRSTAVIHSNVQCQGERRGAHGNHATRCPCIMAIEPEHVVRRVRAWFEQA
ncbi:MAG: glycosyltransferase family 9 protein [Massilia sp.]